MHWLQLVIRAEFTVEVQPLALSITFTASSWKLQSVVGEDFYCDFLGSNTTQSFRFCGSTLHPFAGYFKVLPSG